MPFQGFKQNMVGPQAMGGFTTPFTQGLGLPNGQAVFNLTGQKFQGNPNPQVNINPGLNQPTNMKIDITRQVSSNPVQNIINDIINPLGNTNIDMGPQQTLRPQPSFQRTSPVPNQSQGFLANIGNPAGSGFLSNIGNPYDPMRLRIGQGGGVWF